MITVRPARRQDGRRLQEIEQRAGRRFRDVGLPQVADDPPPSVGDLARYADAGRSWVAVTVDDIPVGYLLMDEVDTTAHLEQVSVDPDHQRAGVGRALIDQARLWAVARGDHAITLTAYAYVSWNAPWYERLGFRVMAEDAIGPELRAIREAERARGLDVAPRVCMRLELGDHSGQLSRDSRVSGRLG